MHTIPPHTLYVTSNRSLCSDVNRFVNRVGLALLLQVAEEGDHFSAGSLGSDNRSKIPPSLEIRSQGKRHSGANIEASCLIRRGTNKASIRVFGQTSGLPYPQFNFDAGFAPVIGFASFVGSD